MKLALKPLVLAVLAAGSMLASQRSEAQVSVDVDISLGSITILYYYSDIDVTVPDAAMAALFVGDLTGCVAGVGADIDCDSGGTALNATGSAGALEVTATADTTPAPVLSDIELNLANVWSVRALGGGANTTVTVALGADATLTSTASGSITVSNPLVDDDATGCDGALTAVFADPGLGATPLTGSVCLDLDLSGATGSGPFDGGADAGDEVYTLTVSNS